MWAFFISRQYREGREYLLAGDETVATKVGKETHGVGRFFSSLFGKPISGISFFGLSLIDVEARRSIPIRIEQFIREKLEKGKSLEKKAAAKKAKSAKEKKPRGRPKGSKNKNKETAPFSAELMQIQGMLKKFQEQNAGFLKIKHIVMDGHFGNKNALRMALECGLELISKLRHDSALFEPFTGEYRGKGPRPRYGSKIDYANLPEKYLKKTSTEKDVQTRFYQAQLLHKEFKNPLNIVILEKTNLKTQAKAHVVFFSSDLDLSYEKMVDFYSLRFQIEFNFRDAKQFWGLEDFMNVTPTAVTNFANLSFFMVNFSHQLLADFRNTNPEAGLIDLKAHYRGRLYLDEAIKMLEKKPEPFLLAQIYSKLAHIGQIHPIHHLLTGT